MAAWLLLVLGTAVAAGVGWQVGKRIDHRRPSAGSPHPWRAAVAALVVGSMLTVAIGATARVPGIATADEAVYDAVVGSRNEFLTSLMALVTQMGSLGANLMTAVLGGLLVFYRLREWRPALALPAAFAVVFVVNIVIDLLDDRPSPSSDLVVGPAGTYPSGGTARVLALAVVAAVLLAGRWGGPRDYRWLLAGAAAVGWVEAASRFILGKHWPLDLAGGIMLGLTAAVTVLLVARQVTPTGPLVVRAEAE